MVSPKVSRDSLMNWVKQASEEDLYAEYEKYRVIHFGPNGDGEKSPEMQIIDEELANRDVAKMKMNSFSGRKSTTRWTDANRWEKD